MIDSHLVQNNKIIFKVSDGFYSLTVLSASSLKVEYGIYGSGVKIQSFAVEAPQTEYTDFSFSHSNDEYVIITPVMTISVSRHTGEITGKNSGGIVFLSKLKLRYSDGKIMLVNKINKNHYYYGLGQKTGFLDKKGREYVMWNTDEPSHTPLRDPLYVSIPFFIEHQPSAGSFGLFVDRTCRLSFDMGCKKSDELRITADDNEIEYYIFCGEDIKSVVSQYTALTGRMQMPPKWALGYHQSRYSYEDEESVLSVAQKFREKKIPCDAVHLDIDYMNGYRVFTWNKKKFRNHGKMIKKLSSMDFKTVVIVDPAVKKDIFYSVYKDGMQKDLFCKTDKDRTYTGEAWAGASAYPNFFKSATKHWWSRNHEELFSEGVSGIWNDMNEPTDFSQEKPGDRTTATVPDDVTADRDGIKLTFKNCHNAYGLEMCKATHHAFTVYKPGRRPFILTRSAYAGIQKYAAVWCGDNHSWWEQLASSIPMYINLGLSGVAFCGGDAGGFQEDASPELFARWMQMASFVPFFRGHSNKGTKLHEPWQFGQEVEDICRKYISLRYEFMPYLYTEIKRACETGLPVMRPLVLEYRDDENTFSLDDQFMVGEDLLVAPVVRPGVSKRMVYLPEGKWYDYWTDKVFSGREFYIADCPLDTMPLFVRAGSIIPKSSAGQSLSEKNISELYINAYKGADACYTLYEDDGVSCDYKNGKYLKTTFSFDNESGKVQVSSQTGDFSPNRDGFRVVIHGD